MNFDYDNPEYDGMQMGHFYQLVYPYTQYVGVGIAYASKKKAKAFIVARYLAGSLSQNVKETPKPVNCK